LNFIYVRASYENETVVEMPHTDTIHSIAAFTQHVGQPYQPKFIKSKANSTNNSNHHIYCLVLVDGRVHHVY